LISVVPVHSFERQR